ncbi:MAG: cation diffusion facilitator family transporter [Methylococcales bacterium]|nr:cation diffusion facilitator family transporter [Methylococcales bacterium]
MSTDHQSTKAILYAFAANLGIALVKTLAAFWSGSGAMLAEAIHSFADSGNQVLLWVGLKRSAKAATDKHPLGYGRESYIWSMMVAMILFSVGGVFSIYEGVLRWHDRQGLENMGLAILVLLVAIGLETFSLRGALAALAQEKGERTLWQWFKETHSSELMVVTGEDIAALAGLVIALISLLLAQVTGNPLFDALGSIAIGVLLVVVAVLIGVQVHSLLLGETDPATQVQIIEFLSQQKAVVTVFNVWAIHQGRQVVVSIKAQLNGELTVAQAVNLTNQWEREIKQRYERVGWIFFELDDQD